MPYYSAQEFTVPAIAGTAASWPSLNKTIADIANGVPAPAMTWSGPGADIFSTLTGSGSGATPPIVAEIGSDFMSQFEAFKKGVNEWALKNNASAKWLKDAGVISEDNQSFSLEKLPQAIADAIMKVLTQVWESIADFIMEYLPVIGLIALALLLIGGGFWKSIK